MSSDPFDVDDLFIDPSTLDALEADALRSTQAPPPLHSHHTRKPSLPPAARPPAPSQKRQAQPYHHQLSAPRKPPAEPRPLNTEPGRTTGGHFGWGENSKHLIDGGERLIRQVRDREGYWGLGKEEEDGEGEGEVVDTLRTVKDLNGGGGGGGVKMENRGAQARREAITASQQSRQGSVPPMMPVVKPGEAPPRPFPQRTLSRSTSVPNRPLSAQAGPSRPPALPAISASQSSQPPASQGSLARRQALELDQEREKREKAERQLAELRAQLDLSKAAAIRPEQGKGKGREMSVEGADPVDEAKLKELQNAVYIAKGEAQVVRRKMQEEKERNAAELERAKQAIADLEARLQEKAKEAQRAVESIKSQAVFQNHAVLNSAARSRQQIQASQRPLPTPVRNGSPRGKSVATEESSILLRSLKAKPPPPPPPKFDALRNAFSSTPTITTRVKRQRTEALSPSPSPKASPSKRRTSVATAAEENGLSVVDFGMIDEEAGRAGAMDADEPLVRDVETGGREAGGEEGDAPDMRAELIYHLFHHVTFSPFVGSAEGDLSEPTLSRLLRASPSRDLDPSGRYAHAFAELLKACADPGVAFEGVLQAGGAALVTGLEVMVPAFDTDVGAVEVAVTMCLLDLLRLTLLLFPDLALALPPSLPGVLRRLAVALFYDAASLIALATTHDASLGIELAEMIRAVCEGFCLGAEGHHLWSRSELVGIVMSLTQPHLPVRIIRSGAELLFAASCRRENYRALMARSDKFAKVSEQPLVERIGRILLSPPSDPPEQQSRLQTTLLRALAQLATADPDAPLLLGERSVLAPALVTVLWRESRGIWGLGERVDADRDLATLHLILLLLHHLVYPLPPLPSSFRSRPAPSASQVFASPTRPSASQSSAAVDWSAADPEPDSDALPIGLNLGQRLHSASIESREFCGVQHLFVSALGALSYAEVDLDMGGQSGREGQIRSMQYLAQDILESVVQGPEGDHVYELYAPPEEAEIEEGPDVEMMDAEAAGVVPAKVNSKREGMDEEGWRQVVHVVDD